MLGVVFFQVWSFVFSLEYEHHLILLQKVTVPSSISSLLAASWNLILKNKQRTQTQLCFLILYIQCNVFFFFPVLTIHYVAISLYSTFCQPPSFTFTVEFFYWFLWGSVWAQKILFSKIWSNSFLKSCSSLGTDQWEDG